MEKYSASADGRKFDREMLFKKPLISFTMDFGCISPLNIRNFVHESKTPFLEQFSIYVEKSRHTYLGYPLNKERVIVWNTDMRGHLRMRISRI